MSKTKRVKREQSKSKKSKKKKVLIVTDGIREGLHDISPDPHYPEYRWYDSEYGWV